jgi:hypothetical protein
MFPWWPEPTLAGNENEYHQSTRLKDGRQGLLVDPGAWSNLAGETWVTDMVNKALDKGLDPKQRSMTEPFVIHGVGTGTNEAAKEVQLPIAVSGTDGKVMIQNYQAPTVSGFGKDLPALLGLECMTKHKAVLEMTEGQEYLTYPGPKGYQITWSEGTVRYKLERAPSGHLILPCDRFENLSDQAIQSHNDNSSTESTLPTSHPMKSPPTPERTQRSISAL